jgi:tRNA threonylcarbamoyladenosine biosynthesis protein TsaE
MTCGSSGATVHCVTTDVEETRALAGALAGLCVPGDIVLLAGDLGAGKTAFAQGFGLALGVTEPITSPTFALLRPYSCGEGAVQTLLHADVYRLDHLQEIADLGLGELVEDGGVAVVEWGDAAEPVLGRGSLAVHIVAGPDEDRRAITISPIGTAWDARWERLVAALAPWVAPR